MNPPRVVAVPAEGWPVLYSFRRCPYAMRARLALLQAAVTVELREVVLRAKPQAMLDISPKGTVPVLVLADGRVIEQSLDIMRWALQQHDPQAWLAQADAPAQQALLALNDGAFKQALDAYKYPERHPQASAETHRAQGEAVFIALLEQRLQNQPFLAGASAGFTDLAIFPFVRQWAAVDAAGFGASRWVAVRAWLNGWLGSELFARAMQKYPAWHADQAAVVFPPPATA